MGGADAIIKSGELENTEYLIGVHLRPKEELPLGKIAPTVLHGASGSIKVTVHGENAHGARPQQGINAIEAASLIISSVQALHMDPTIPHSIKPTQIFSGNTPFNIIPDLATIVFDLRAQTNEMMECLKKIWRQQPVMLRPVLVQTLIVSGMEVFLQPPGLTI